MSDFFNLVSQMGVYPFLVILWFKLDATQKAHLAMIKYLEEVCPHCGKVKILLPK